MTDVIIDDDIVPVNKLRRPMVIETEVRTDTVTKRRVGSTTSSSRSVHDILENTKSPTDGLPPTTYTYAHSVSYMPVTQNGSYSVPVMARRDLHGEYRPYSPSNSVFSSPTRFITNVKSQLTNGYSAIRDRLTHHNNEQSSSSSAAPIPSSPRNSRSSSQSSKSGQSSSYGLRNRPIHSTPRDTVTKQGKHRKSQDDDDDDKENVDDQEQKLGEEQSDDNKDNFIVKLLKKILHFPLDILSFIWHKLFGIPWWLLIPLLLFLGLYAFPNSVCKPFEHYPESKIYQNCRKFQEYTNNVTNNSVGFIQKQTYDRGVDAYKTSSSFIKNLKATALDKFDDLYIGTKKFFRGKANKVTEKVNDVVGPATDAAKKYCDDGLAKVNGLYEDLKREKDKLVGNGPALKPYLEQELETLIRKVLDEYADDETGQADFALEANGGKIVDTKCTEYTDEPNQNVVKFLGIPIVHMSKQPNIMIKVGRMPGQCFPFKGDQGSVVIKLAVPVKPSEFVLEHLPKDLSVVGHINSAPNNFTVYALKDKNDKEGKVLGRYFYDAENGPSLQRFKPQLVNVPVVEYIEVRVTSNWGNPTYTCLYRFRVHGDLQSIQPSAPPAA